MSLPDGINAGRFAQLLELAREEDFAEAGDLTTALMAVERSDARRTWSVVARKAGRLCGNALLPNLLAALAPGAKADLIRRDGEDVEAGATVSRIVGPVGVVLSGERIVLNIVQRLSGVATLTQQFVRAVSGTAAQIYDTRKTTPGLRDLERYAVRMGGGRNHRDGLHDAVLIKDNHLADSGTGRFGYRVFEMLNAIGRLPVKPRFVEVEVDTLEQFREVLAVVGIDVILLDNFDPAALAEAVGLRDSMGLRGRIALEASGGVTLETVAAIARSGVERIAVGALTHSAPALDIGLDAME